MYTLLDEVRISTPEKRYMASLRGVGDTAKETKGKQSAHERKKQRISCPELKKKSNRRLLLVQKAHGRNQSS